MSLGIPLNRNGSLRIARPGRDWSGGLMAIAFGHSTWGVTDGFLSVPKNSTVAFYNSAGESLNVRKAIEVISDPSDIDTPDDIVQQFKSVQNLSLLPAPEHLGKIRAAYETAERYGKAIPVVTSTTGEGVTLKDILKALPDRYVLWLGCRGRQII